MLEHLTADWNAIEVQTAWKLEPVLCYKDSDSSASDDQPMTATTPLSNPARPENGKPNGASPDIAPEEGEVQEDSAIDNAQGPNRSDAQAAATETPSTSSPSLPFLGVK